METKAYKPCKRCKKTNVEILPFSVREEDELCEWCRLSLKAGIDDFQLLRENEKRTKQPNDMYEDDWDGLEDLEDFGAFSDEGIMPGCHSGWTDIDYEQREMNEFCKRMRKIGWIIRAVREKMGLSIAELAQAVDMPDFIEENIENGEVHFLTVEPVVPVPLANKDMLSNKKPDRKQKKWWETCDDYELREKVWKYLYDRCPTAN